MKAEKLLDAIGGINDNMITEANTIKVKSVKRAWLHFAPVAACIVITLVAVMTMVLRPSNHKCVGTLPPPELPMLTVNEDTGDFGYEGYFAYDISELKNGNPWSENDKLTSLPVFKNPVRYDNAGVRIEGGLSADEMMEKARETAAVMGLTVDSVYTNPSEEHLQWEGEKARNNPHIVFDPQPSEAIAVCGDINIAALANGAVRIFFENGVKLSEEYTLTAYDNNEQQARAVTQYLLKQYASVISMKSPALDFFADYTYDGQRISTFSYSAFENSGSLTDKIIGYNFNRVNFFPNDEGLLQTIFRYSADLSQKLGDYPIITANQARELLLQKRYITSVPEELPDEKYIADVELIYRTGRHDEVFMPYYRFLVELPTAVQPIEGLKTYGVFYVPAVDGRYLNNLPLYDGSIN